MNSNAARYGWKEFIYVLRESSFDRAYEREDGIREAIFRIQYKDFPDVHISLSEGIVAFSDYTDVNQLLKRADELLYRGKAKGKNRLERE